MIWKFLFGVLVGFLGHVAFYDASKRMPAPELSRHGIGVLLTWPVFLWMNQDRCGHVNFLASFVSVGLGAAIARFIRVLLAV